MKVYFTASIAAIEQYKPNYEAIVKSLKAGNNKVISEHIMGGTTETKISNSTREERLQFHSKLENWIKSSDCMIAECSFPSISVGYEISLALRVGKPVLILYSVGDPPSLLAYHKDEKVICEKYNVKNVNNILEDFLAFVEAKSDLRFTFFITPHISAYLDEISKEEKLPKAVYLRKLIEEDMSKKHK